MDFWCEFFDIHMNDNGITCPNCHGLNGKT
jgi:hypothetical protein